MNFSRRKFIQTVGLASLGSLTYNCIPKTSASPRNSGSSENMNVLFMSIEDSSPQRYGCYGNPVVKTPHIDRFASQGLQFNLAHCNGPVCNPSRTSLYTGIRPETSGVTSNRHDWREYLPDTQTLPEYLREQGYETISCGKSFHGSFPSGGAWDRDIGESEGLPPRQNSPRPLIGPDITYAEARQRARSQNIRVPGGSPFLWGTSGLEDWEERDGRIAEQATRFLAEDHPKPFFLNLGFHAPHLPFTAPAEYFDMYNPDDIVLPDNPPDDLDDTPYYDGKHRDQYKIGKDYWKRAILAHYATISFVDAQIGKVIQALESSPYAENTMVAIWTDHGYMLGEHFRWRKVDLFEESVRVLLLMKIPGATTPGSYCDRPVESVDILPTLIDFCGLEVPQNIEGISMRELVVDPGIAWKKGALTVSPDGQAYSLRTERWRYNQYADADNNELYDHANDPHEYRNLYRKPGYESAIRELDDLVNAGWKALLPT